MGDAAEEYLNECYAAGDDLAAEGHPMTKLAIIIDEIGGNCPVQADGTIGGQPFYFRARGEHWSFGVGADPIGEPDWYYQEEYPGEPYAAGWMTLDEARAFISKAAEAAHEAYCRVAKEHFGQFARLK